jgi:F-type H+-transporting ATPase subunit epsilon
MSTTIKLNIISPGKEIITEEVVSVTTESIDGKVEFLANHAPIIISTVPTITVFVKEDGSNRELFTSEGILYIRNNEINFCCDSAEWPHEIDVERAKNAMERANKRLNSDDSIDEERAKRALARAMTRLNLKKSI